MNDLFREKASDWDSQPLPVQLSQGIFGALQSRVPFDAGLTVMDFGAGTGLITGRVAPLVKRVIAVDVSPAMLEQLSKKPELQGKVDVVCQDLLQKPLGQTVDLIVSAMAMHHVQDTAALMRVFFAHLTPGGRVALADLDSEDGSFHQPGTEGVFHSGFDRAALGALLADAGFVDVEFATATEVSRDGLRRYPVFLVTARRR